MKCCWRSFESRNERRSILKLDAKPEAGVVAEIGVGFVRFGTDKTNAYVVGAGHNERIYRTKSSGVKQDESTRALRFWQASINCRNTVDQHAIVLSELRCAFCFGSFKSFLIGEVRRRY
jgi:hypothetical protein